MINFPNSPEEGDTYAYGGLSYIYQDPPGYWLILDSDPSYIPPSNSTISDVGASAPSSPDNGQLWYNTTVGKLFIYLDDGDSNQWIQVT